MRTHRECLNCFQKTKGNYCKNCGQKTDTKKLKTWDVALELWQLFTNIERSFPNTLKSMLQEPGVTMSNYLKGQRKRYHNPITYFAVGILVYTLLGNFFRSKNLYVETLLVFDQYSLFAILGFVAAIGYAFSGMPKFGFVEVLVILAYVYGTVLLVINPALLLIELPFLEFKNSANWRYFTVFWDLPVIAYVVYAFRSFFIVQSMSMQRLVNTVLIALSVYLIFMVCLAKEVTS